MCLILLAHDAHPDYRLVVAANRDEFYARPTAPAAPWPEAPHVVAGRDLEAGGTWMGVTRDGRWAAVTNHHDPGERAKGERSRGALVGDYLLGAAPPLDYLRRVEAEGERYAGFNLLAGDAESLGWLSNRAPGPRPLAPGIYGLSNALLDTSWPKVERGKRELRLLLASDPTPDALLDILLDRTLAEEATLPGGGPLSASFVATPGYGTRSSTALLVDRAGRALLVERSFSPEREGWTEARWEVG